MREPAGLRCTLSVAPTASTSGTMTFEQTVGVVYLKAVEHERQLVPRAAVAQSLSDQRMPRCDLADLARLHGTNWDSKYPRPINGLGEFVVD